MAISFASALEFSFQSPDKVSMGEPFDVNVEAATNEIYDIKIYVYDDVKEYSEIYDGESWKSSHFYLRGIFPEEKNFKVRSHYGGQTEICVQMRKSGTNGFDKLCKNIIVEHSQNKDEEIEKIPERGSKEDVEAREESERGIKNLEYKFKKDNNNQKIVLNYPKSSKIENTREPYVTKKGKVRIGVFFGFMGVLILIIIFLSLRRL